MVKLNKKALLIIIGICLLLLLIFSSKTYAANASISCNGTATVGEAITISVSGSAVQWNLTLSVNGTVIAQSNELDNYESNIPISFSGTYTPTSEGNITVTLTGSITEYEGGVVTRNFASKTITVQAKQEPEPPVNNNANSNTSTNTNTNTGTNTNTNTSTSTNSNTNINKNTTTISETPTKSSNNYLESIKLSAGTLSPEFNKRVTSYTVNVEENTEKIRITARAEDDDAKVKGDGEITLEDDETIVKIQVVAENGSTNTYTIKVQKGASDEEENRTIGIQAIGLDAIKENGEYIKVELMPSFDPLIYEYTCSVERDVVSLSVEAVPNIEGMTVEILGGKNLEIGENVVTIIVKNPETEETLTYQILVQKSSLDEEALSTLKEQQEQHAKAELIKKIIFAICVSIITIAGIIFAIIEYKYVKTKENAFGDSEVPEYNENMTLEDESTEIKDNSFKGKKSGRHF